MTKTVDSAIVPIPGIPEEYVIDINDRRLLERLRADGLAQMECPGMRPDWMDAYRGFVASVERLDAMWARCSVSAKPSMDSLSDGSGAHLID